jgi:hypothetical protein
MPGLPIVHIPHPMAGRKKEEVLAIAARAVPEILKILTADAEELEQEYIEKAVLTKSRWRHKALFGDDFSSAKAPEKLKAPASLCAVFLRKGKTLGQGRGA